MRLRQLSHVLVGLAAACLATPLVARASDAFLEAPPAEVAEASPAYRYAQMPSDEALAELWRRNILFERVEPIGRVRTPIRLTGLLHGVHIHSSLPEEERTSTVFELCDARLALVLDDFAALLARRDIVEVVHYTMYRHAVGGAAQSSLGGAVVGDSEPVRFGLPEAPSRVRLAPSRPNAWQMLSARDKMVGRDEQEAAGDAAKRGKRGKASKGKKPAVRGRGRPPAAAADQPKRGAGNSRHPDGLAIDIGAFRKRDGTWLRIGNDFGGTIGASTCGPGASPPKSERGAELWAIVCEAHAAKLFTYVLSPNFDEPHADHLHMEIKPGVRWFLYH